MWSKKKTGKTGKQQTVIFMWTQQRFMSLHFITFNHCFHPVGSFLEGMLDTARFKELAF